MTGLEARVEVDRIFVTSPVVPVLLPGFVSHRHDSKVNFFPQRDDITRERKFGGKWNCCQEVACGKRELK